MAAIRSCDRASGKIPLSVILNEVEPEQLASAPQPTEDGGYRGHQASSHGSSPASSLGSPQPQHRGFNTQTPTEPRDPFGAYGKRNISAPEHRSRSRPWSDSNMPDRRPRPPRPSYSEEQKFFIMYARIIRDNTWPEIEDRFEKLFGTRTKGGLTSVYYRVRREWGLMEVLKSGPGSYAADCREVDQRAMNFSREFLSQIGYLPSVN